MRAQGDLVCSATDPRRMATRIEWAQRILRPWFEASKTACCAPLEESAVDVAVKGRAR